MPRHMIAYWMTFSARPRSLSDSPKRRSRITHVGTRRPPPIGRGQTPHRRRRSIKIPSRRLRPTVVASGPERTIPCLYDRISAAPFRERANRRLANGLRPDAGPACLLEIRASRCLTSSNSGRAARCIGRLRRRGAPRCSRNKPPSSVRCGRWALTGFEVPADEKAPR